MSLIRKFDLFAVALFSGIFALSLSFANISSVNNVHNEIYNQKGITVPVESGIDTNNLSSVHYLFQQIDRANEILNGSITTNYATGADAIYNPVAISKVATDVNELIVEIPTFNITTASVSSFSFQISSSGNFVINWGDGTIDTITKTNTTSTTYSHNYSVAGVRTIKLRGNATGHNPSTTTASISFASNSNLTGISGNLGKIFAAVNGTSPSFYRTFYGCSNLTGTIPNGLFSGINGAPTSYMFSRTFQNCTGLTGSIPSDLFSGLSGAPAQYMFQLTFMGCSGLTGSIPETLFSGITGSPQSYMYQSTFSYCTGLTGIIPENLFSGINGAPAPHMFSTTFLLCSGLTGNIPNGLFAGINGNPAMFMFWATFQSCTGLTGIEGGLFAGINGTPANGMFYQTFTQCSGLTSLPTNLFGSFTGAPAESMFNAIFMGCTGLTTIENGIWDLSGMTNSSANYIFDSMFYNCPNITSESPSISSTDSTKLWTKFSVHTPTVNQKPFTGATSMSDYASIPTTWK